MVKFITQRIRPGRGFAHIFHLSFVAIIPLLVFVFVRLELAGVALVVILISKWRMLSVRPRYWLAHVRTNAIDIAFSLSILVFMLQTASFSWQLFWVAAYEAWILLLKPRDDVISVSLQAVMGQLAGLTAMFLAFPEVPLSVYLLLTGLLSYSAARHFFGSFDEPRVQVHSVIWALVSVNIMWVLGHWLVFVGRVAMPAVVLGSLSFTFVGLYFLMETDRLTPRLRRQIYIIILAIMAVLTIWLIRSTNLEI